MLKRQDKMRIAYIILTCEAYEKTRKAWQMETVFQGVPKEDIYYLGHVMRPEDRLFSWGAKDDYDSLPYKFVDFFVKGKEVLLEGYDWYFLMDDDTYLYVDRLYKRIAEQLGSVHPYVDSYMEGYVMTHLANTEWGVYHSGGAGTLLTARVYEEVREKLKESIQTGDGRYKTPHWCADICLGLWTAGARREHVDEYYTEMSPVAGRKDKVDREAITFHHLKTKEDYWAHWLLGQTC